MKRRQISEGRKGLFYGGMLMIAIGVVVFVSNFFIMWNRDNNSFLEDEPFNFNKHSREFDDRGKGMMTRAFIGMGLLIAGTFMMRVGRRGAAGSGLVLDPQQARQDLEPWSRAGGGMVKDALDEADIDLGGKSEEVVKVRCRKCKTLNDEDAKFCDECGEAL